MLCLRLGGGFLLIICGTFAGIYCSEKLGRRIRLFEEYIHFLTQAEAMIGHTAASVREIFGNIRGLPMIKPIIKKTLTELDGGADLADAWSKAVKGVIGEKEDRELINYFGQTFGTTDCSGEMGKLALHKETAERKHTELLEEYRTKRRLYRILGMFGGTLTAVILL